jgi:predicted solute-binding protein
MGCVIIINMNENITKFVGRPKQSGSLKQAFELEPSWTARMLSEALWSRFQTLEVLPFADPTEFHHKTETYNDLVKIGREALENPLLWEVGDGAEAKKEVTEMIARFT